MEKDLIKIIHNYGVLPQLKYFQSEVFELNEAIIKAENYEPNPNDSYTKLCCNANSYIEHIAEELADVTVMLKQFQAYYGITDEEIEEVMRFKIERQKERMKNEK